MSDQSLQVITINLSGRKLDRDTNDLNLINNIGQDLYIKNKQFIKEKIKDNWYGVIEPTSGTFIASQDPLKLFEYTNKNFKNKLFFVIGLLRNNFLKNV